MIDNPQGPCDGESMDERKQSLNGLIAKAFDVYERCNVGLGRVVTEVRMRKGRSNVTSKRRLMTQDSRRVRPHKSPHARTAKKTVRD